MPLETPLLSGEILVDNAVKSFSNADVYVRLQDVSFMDRSSKVISELIKENVSYSSVTHNKLEFALSGHLPDIRRKYTISVHIDVDGDGKPSVGDLINVQSYPVLTCGNPDNVLVKVELIV